MKDEHKRLYKDIISDKSIEPFNKHLGVPIDNQIDIELQFNGLKSVMAALAMEKLVPYASKIIRYGDKGEELRPIYKSFVTDYKKEKILPWILSLHGKFGDIPYVASISPGWNGCSIIFTFDKDSNFQPFIEKFRESVRMNNIYKGKVFSSSGTFIPRKKDITLDNIYLPSETKTLIKNNILNFFDKKEIFDANSIPFRRGILLIGAPGTGKTYLGGILHSIMKDVSFIWTKAADLDYQQSFQMIAAFASDVSPSVLFFEDIDYLDPGNRIVMSEFLNVLDGQPPLENVLFVTTCNSDKLPPNLGDRPGRIDCKISFPLPEESIRLKYLRDLTKAKNLILDDSELQELAKNTEGFTPAHLKNFIEFAMLIAINENSIHENKTVKVTVDIAKKALEIIKSGKS